MKYIIIKFSIVVSLVIFFKLFAFPAMAFDEVPDVQNPPAGCGVWMPGYTACERCLFFYRRNFSLILVTNFFYTGF